MATALLDSNGNYIPQKGTAGAGNVIDFSIRQGESDVFGRTFGGAMCLESALYTADQLIVTGPALIYGYIVHVVTATAAVTIEDAVTAGTGTTKLTIPAAKAVGEYALPLGIYCATGLFLNYAASATGTISVLYLPAV